MELLNGVKSSYLMAMLFRVIIIIAITSYHQVNQIKSGHFARKASSFGLYLKLSTLLTIAKLISIIVQVSFLIIKNVTKTFLFLCLYFPILFLDSQLL